MAELSEFLLARLAEDEAVASNTFEVVITRQRPEDVVGVDFSTRPSRPPGLTALGVRGDRASFLTFGHPYPERWLAEVEAHRRIVERHKDCGTGRGYCDDGGHGYDEDGCPDLATLASVYAGHDAYREEWAL